MVDRKPGAGNQKKRPAFAPASPAAYIVGARTSLVGRSAQGRWAVPKVKIVSVLAENRPGVLAKICGELARRRNNLLGIYAPEGDGAGVKVLAADAEGARWQLSQLKYSCYLEEAISIELDNKPGAFAKACGKLAAAGVNVRYAFATAPPESKKAVIVVGVSDTDSAVAALRRS